MKLIYIKSTMEPKDYATIRTILKQEQGEKIAPYVFKLTDTKTIEKYLKREKITYEIYYRSGTKEFVPNQGMKLDIPEVVMEGLSENAESKFDQASNRRQKRTRKEEEIVKPNKKRTLSPTEEAEHINQNNTILQEEAIKESSRTSQKRTREDTNEPEQDKKKPKLADVNQVEPRTSQKRTFEEEDLKEIRPSKKPLLESEKENQSPRTNQKRKLEEGDNESEEGYQVTSHKKPKITDTNHEATSVKRKRDENEENEEPSKKRRFDD